jgi:hypothetical protein
MAAVAATLGLGSCATTRTNTLDAALIQLVAGLDPNGPYRHPTGDERQQALTGTDLLLRGDTAAAQEWFDLLGMDTSTAVDAATGRVYALAASHSYSDRSWGLLVIDLTAPGPHLVLEVPHPGADQDSERIGLALLRAVPGAALLVAGAHRRAADRAADVAHQPDSLFHAIATHLADIGLAQLQLHGYHDDSLPSHEIVISAGAGQPGPLAQQAAERLVARGFDVCRAWRRDCGDLEGRRNAQGRAAAEHGHPFVHLEINRSTRADPDRRATLIDALAVTYTPT